MITDEEGTVLVSGRLLAEIVRSLPARPVEMSTEGTRTTLKCGSAVFTLMTLPDDEYPTLPGMPPEAGAVGADVLASAITQVAIAAGRDDTLPALTGIRMELEGDTVTLVATDRYRLAVRELHWQPVKADTSGAVLVPARVLVDAARSLTTAAEVQIALTPPSDDGGHGEGIIGFEGGGRQTTTRLLGGEYPRYQSLLPNEFNAVAELPTAPFVRGGQARRPGGRAQHPGPAGLLRRRAGAGGGRPATRPRPRRRSRPASTATTMQIAFNPQYLLDGLSAIDSDVARFRSPRRPGPP